MDVPMSLASDEQPYVCIAVWLTLKLTCACDAVCAHNLIFIRCRNIQHVGSSARTACTFVSLCGWLWNWLLRSMRCEVMIQSPFTVNTCNTGGNWLAIIFVEWMYPCRWLWTNRACVCFAVWLPLKMNVPFAAVWNHNVFLICYQNIQQWRQSIRDDLRWMAVSMSVALHEQHVRLCCCDWLWHWMLCSMRCEVIIQSSFAVEIYDNGDDLSAYLRWMDVPML